MLTGDNIAYSFNGLSLLNASDVLGTVLVVGSMAGKVPALIGVYLLVGVCEIGGDTKQTNIKYSNSTKHVCSALGRKIRHIMGFQQDSMSVRIDSKASLGRQYLS